MKINFHFGFLCSWNQKRKKNMYSVFQPAEHILDMCYFTMSEDIEKNMWNFGNPISVQFGFVRCFCRSSCDCVDVFLVTFRFVIFQMSHHRVKWRIENCVEIYSVSRKIWKTNEMEIRKEKMKNHNLNLGCSATSSNRCQCATPHLAMRPPKYFFEKKKKRILK